jgi:hypothetical protein
MEKQIILYNLAKGVTDEKYKEYVLTDKGPLIESLSSVNKYELWKIVHAQSGNIPYNYVGIMEVSSLEQFAQKDVPSDKFKGFEKKWLPMVSDVHILSGIKIY